MKKSDAISKFVAALEQECPDATVSIDVPHDPKGEWWLDIASGGFRTEVGWREAFGFGVFTSEEAGFGDRPDEIYKKFGDACTRVCQLEAHWRRSKSVGAMGLRDLRHLVGTPQTELATALKTNQAAVSRLENREDLLLSSLVHYVAAMGGELKMRVKFKDFEAPVRLPFRLGK